MKKKDEQQKNPTQTEREGLDLIIGHMNDSDITDYYNAVNPTSGGKIKKGIAYLEKITKNNR